MQKKSIFLLASLLLTSGCATTQYRAVSIISDPPGAKIEINNNYVGQTPLTTTLSYVVDYNDWPNQRIYSNYAIVAYPVNQGQYVQSKQITWPLPNTIYFNMNLEPTTATIKTDQKVTVKSESN